MNQKKSKSKTYQLSKEEKETARENRINRLKYCVKQLEFIDPRIKLMILMYLGLAGDYHRAYSIRELSRIFKTKKEIIEYLIIDNLPRLKDYEEMEQDKI